MTKQGKAINVGQRIATAEHKINDLCQSDEVGNPSDGSLLTRHSSPKNKNDYPR